MISILKSIFKELILAVLCFSTILTGCQSDKTETTAHFYTSKKGQPVVGDPSNHNNDIKTDPKIDSEDIHKTHIISDNSQVGSDHPTSDSLSYPKNKKKRSKKIKKEQMKKDSSFTPTENGRIYEKIDINTASEKELRKLPGVGPLTATKIINYRKRKPFRNTRDLLKIRGIGKVKFAKIKDSITVS